MRRASPVVSVVTPFHNTGEFLEECVESVLAQSLDDFEYILVDNHSTDEGRRIASHYAQADKRIRLITPPSFLSQGANFNFALRQISADSAYCKMVLADDWLYPHCLAEMVALADANPSVGLVSSYVLAESTVWGAGLPSHRTVFSGHEVGHAFLADRIFPFGNQSSVMYRADVVRGRDPFFDESTVFFDTDAALRTLSDHDFGFVHQVLSFFRIHHGSITSQTQTYTPVAADHMIAVRNHGPTFLSSVELKQRSQETTGWFYEGLGRQRLRELARARDDSFWEYQRRCLAAARSELSAVLVWRGMARALLVSAMFPGDHLRRLRRRWRSRRLPRRADTFE
jgi:glycosyltransferase involved in cell wall biosynthesis